MGADPPPHGVKVARRNTAKLRAARLLLGWTEKDFARKSKVSLAAIVRAEKSEGEPIITIVQLDALMKTLRTAGIEFTSENNVALGARLRKSHA